MSETYALSESHDESGLYQIRLMGHHADRWRDWFGGLTITLEEDGDTLLTGPSTTLGTGQTDQSDIK